MSEPTSIPDPAPGVWESLGDYRDIRVLRSAEGIARISINRPEKRNAFRPGTVQELCDAFSRVRDDPGIGVVLFVRMFESDRACGESLWDYGIFLLVMTCVGAAAIVCIVCMRALD